MNTVATSLAAAGGIALNVGFILIKFQPLMRLALSLRSFERSSAAGYDTSHLADVIRAALGGDRTPPAT